MDDAAQRLNTLAMACSAADASQGMTSLQQALQIALPDHDFQHVLSRSGWYRPGGLLDAAGERVTDNIRQHLEQIIGTDLDGFVERSRDAGLIATRLQGQTHYLVADIGDAPEDFIQLEVEELQEVSDRELLPDGWWPDDVEDLLDPMDRAALPPEPIGQPRFVFRRIQSVPELLAATGDRLSSLKRFMYDWSASSAARSGRFSHHWVLALRESEGSDGVHYLSAKPIPADPRPEISLMPYAGKHGEALVDDIRQFDHATGYSFAWFFTMLTSRKVPFELGEAVLADLAADFDYLPPRDALILAAWSNKRYAV